MSHDPPIVNAGFRSTNFWVVGRGPARLLVDLGWPGLIGALLAELERKSVPVAEIRYGLATHYHIDHAGAAQDLKNLGMTLIVTEEQVAAVPLMTQWTKPADRYTEIVPAGNRVVSCADSRALLADLGLAGEIVPTPGHSDDSVTLVLDQGVAFTGDLTLEQMATEADAAVVASSWERLRRMGVRTVYPGHGAPYPLRRG